MQIYLVGGGVRDLLLGRTVRDKDYLVIGASRHEFHATFPQAREVGKAFPVFLMDGKEFAFPRENTLEQDLLSRDLTINAMALNQEGELICHPQALSDLKNKILRPTSKTSLSDDPVRVVRAARFHAQFPNFTPHDSLLADMGKLDNSEKLGAIAADRVGQEIRKALAARKPGNFLRLLAAGNCLRPWFSEHASLAKSQNSSHPGNLLEDTAALMDQTAENPLRAWMAFCLALKKQKGRNDYQPYPEAAERLGARVRLPLRYIQAGRKAVLLHQEAIRYEKLSPAYKVELLMNAHISGITKPLFQLAAILRGTEFPEQALDDLHTILSIHLPEKERNLGVLSGEKLHELRAAALLK